MGSRQARPLNTLMLERKSSPALSISTSEDYLTTRVPTPEKEEHILSPLELLPQELFWKVVEFTPESVFVLRLTSLTIRARVDEFALQAATIPLVERLCISNDCADDPVHFIIITVPEIKANLFELRIKVRKPQPGSIKLIMRSIKIDGDGKLEKTSIEYMLILPDEDDALLEILRECIGRRIGMLWLSEYEDIASLRALCRLLEGLYCEQLEFLMSTLTQNAANHLLWRLTEHKVDVLKLSTTDISDVEPEWFLIELSSLVQSIHISRHQFDASHDLFGVRNCEWAPVFLNMFSKKLNKLKIDVPEFLDLEDAKAIKEYLPTLGKKVWFEASCNKFPYALQYTANLHSVKADPSSKSEPLLSIKHISRKDEPFDV